MNPGSFTRTYTVGIREVFKQRLTCADFVLDTSHSPIFAEYVDPFGGEHPVLGGPRVHEQVVGLVLTVQLGAQVSKHVSVCISTCRGGAGSLSVRAAGAV